MSKPDIFNFNPEHFKGYGLNIEKLLNEIVKNLIEAREIWIKACLDKLLPEAAIKNLQSQEYFTLITAKDIKIIRKVYPNKEELWVNGKLYSTFIIELLPKLKLFIDSNLNLSPIDKI